MRSWALRAFRASRLGQAAPLSSLAVLCAVALCVKLRAGERGVCARAEARDAAARNLRAAMSAAAAAAAAEEASNRFNRSIPAMLLLSLNWREEPRWLEHWLVAAARRLRGVRFAVALSARSTAQAEELRSVALAAPRVEVHFSEAFCEGAARAAPPRGPPPQRRAGFRARRPVYARAPSRAELRTCCARTLSLAAKCTLLRRAA